MEDWVNITKVALNKRYFEMQEGSKTSPVLVKADEVSL